MAGVGWGWWWSMLTRTFSKAPDKSWQTKRRSKVGMFTADSQGVNKHQMDSSLHLTMSTIIDLRHWSQLQHSHPPVTFHQLPVRASVRQICVCVKQYLSIGPLQDPGISMPYSWHSCRSNSILGKFTRGKIETTETTRYYPCYRNVRVVNT